MKHYVYFISLNVVGKQGNTIFPANCEYGMEKEINSIKDINEIERLIDSQIEEKESHAIISSYQLLRIEEE